MALPMKKSANKNDLRRLMNERRNELKGKTKISSPIASYNSLGQLTCIVCDLPIKSEALWNAHIAGRVHKENALLFKSKQTEVNSSTATTAGVKRKADTISEKPKKQKLAAQTEPPEESDDCTSDAVIPQKDTVSSILTSYSSSSDDESDSEHMETQPPATAPGPPADAVETPTKDNPVNAGLKCSSAKSLPEGFFDDPILDAKVRQVEYKNPMEEEWEKFKKAMAEEANLSQAIIEEDMEESNVERDIMEIDEQMHHWSKVEALLEQKDNLKKEKGKSEDDSDESNSADETEFDEFLDWRSKQAWKI